MNEIIKAGYESIRLSFSKKSTYEKITAIMFLPLLAVALYLVTGILSHTFADVDIPNEYRESANVFMTMELLKGNNPYSLSSLNGDLPPMIYLYGPLYSLITAAFGLLLKAEGLLPDIVLLHYLVTFVCIIITAALGFMMTKKRTGSLTLGMAAFIFLIYCSWRYNFVNAVPDSMGLTIMVLILYILSEKDFKGKELLCAVLTAAVFFTKQYYLLIAGTAVIYLFLCKGIKNTLKYLISLAVIFLTTAFILKTTCPLYETYMLYFAKGPGKGVASVVKRGSVKMTGMEYNFSQIMSLGGIFVMFFLTELLCCVYFLVRFIKTWRQSGEETAAGNVFKKTALVLEKTGIEDYDILMLIHMAVSGICLLYIGQNDGAWLSYYLELFMPALILGALALFKKTSDPLSSKGFYKINHRTTLLILSGYLLIFLGFTVSKADERLPVSPLSEEDYSEWERAENVLNDNTGDMYLYPLLSYYGIHHDIYVYNTGQPFVVSEKFYKSYHKHPDMMERYPYAEDIFTSHFGYREKILQKVHNGEYSVVSYIEGMDEVFKREDLSIKYKKKGTFALRTGRQVWNVELWVLK